jgi:DNA-binding beta-propeller fold protein YncE
VKTTEHARKSPAAKTGTFATRGGLLRGGGSGAPSLRLLATCLGLALLVAGLAIPSDASAAVKYPQLGEIVGPTPGEHFTGLNSESVAVNNKNGHIYVADSGAHRVYNFASSADTSPTVWDGTSTPAGEFEGKLALAADNSSGDVYVADSGHKVIDKFDSVGNLIESFGDTEGTPDGQLAGLKAPAGSFSLPFFGSFGIAVDQAGGELYAIDSGHQLIDVFNSSGAYLRSISDPEAIAEGLFGCGGNFTDGIAVNATSGHIFVSDSCPEKVYEFNAAGKFLSLWNGNDKPLPSSKTPAEGFSGYVSVALNNTSGDLYISASFQEVVDRFDSSGEFKDQITGTPGGQGPGIAVDQASGDVYVSDNGTGSVKIFGPKAVLLPTVITEGPTEVGPHQVTLNGTVNPEGLALSACEFEWGTTTAYGHSAACEAAVPVDSNPHAVKAKLEGLEAGQTYHYRLKATNANGSEAGADESFETPPPPSIDAAFYEHLTETTVDLKTEINPRGAETTCQIEWGPSAEPGNPSVAYENTDPCEPPEIIAANFDLPASLHLEGLSKDTSYHWRVAATNASGTTTGPEHTFVFLSPPEHESCPSNEAFRTGASATLPDCRVYEMVTPPSKNGAAVGNVFIGLLPDFSADGSRLVLTSLQCFADAVSCNADRGSNEGSSFAFTRAGTGWVANSLAGPAGQFGVGNVRDVSADTGMALLSLPTSPQRQDDFYARAPDGSLTDIGPVSPPALGAQGPRGPTYYTLATADFSHVVFEAQFPWPYDETQEGHATPYEYVGAANTDPFLVAVTGAQNSTDLISQCGALAPRENNGSTISADGSTVYVTVEPCSTGTGANAGKEVPAYELYARIDGETTHPETVNISASQCGSGAGTDEFACRNAPPADSNFEGASTDGSIAYFTSTRQLTDQASEDNNSGDSAFRPGCHETVGPNGCNLYLHDRSLPPGQRLLDASAGSGPGQGPRVQGVMATSADGSHAYFVARGVLAGNPGAATDPETGELQQAEAGANNLYLYQRDAAHPSGLTTFIATLAASDKNEWQTGAIGFANFTPDGRFLLFTSAAHLTRDDHASTRQVFRYDAQTGQLLRVSIGQRGFNDNGNAGTGSARIVPGGHLSSFADGNARRNPSMSNDGSRVFFMSPIGLTPGALDDVPIQEKSGEPQYAQNIYEWQAPSSAGCSQAQGCVSLISDGRDTSSVPQPACADSPQNSTTCLLGTDASGKNVFFTTGNSLAPQDTDTGIDFYDARVGGGFTAASGTTPCQTSEVCHQGGTAEGPAQSPASAGFEGPEEDANHPRKPKCKRGFAGKHGKCVAKHHGKHKKHAKARRHANPNRRAGR